MHQTCAMHNFSKSQNFERFFKYIIKSISFAYHLAIPFNTAAWVFVLEKNLVVLKFYIFRSIPYFRKSSCYMRLPFLLFLSVVFEVNLNHSLAGV